MGTLLPHLHFDTDGMPGEAAYAEARKAVGFLGDLVVAPEHRAAFHACSDVWVFGDLIVESHAMPVPFRTERTAAHVASSRLDQIVIALITSGPAVVQTTDGEATLAEGGVFVIDRAQPITVDLAPTRIVMLTTPRGLLLPLLTPGALLHGLVLPAPARELLGDYMASLARQLRFMTQAEAPFLQRGSCELIAACIERSRDGMERAGRQLQHSLLAEARHIVDASLADPALGADQLCAALAVSRAKLYRLFEVEGGVAAFIQRRRLRAAHRLLVQSGEQRRVSEIAFACGFTSEAHFSRAFRAQFGLPPSAARRSGAAGALPAEEDDANVAQVFRRWMLEQE